MTVAHEEQFRRLLRWYPRGWRERNGEVLVGTMLDDAARQGRGTPSWAERLSAVAYGLGSRLDGRLALGAALTALAVAAVCGGVMVWAVQRLAAAGATWVLPVLAVAIGPGLIALGVASLMRQRGVLSEPRAVAVVVLSILALTLAALAQVAWGAGFDAADRGVPLTGLAAGWAWLFGAAWVLGAAAIVVFSDSLLRLTRLPRVASAILGVAVGVLLAPFIGLSLMSPYTVAIGSAGLAVVILIPTQLPHRPTRVELPKSASKARAWTGVSTRTKQFARVLASATCLASAVGVADALSGARWLATVDETEVMGQGISIALLSALPLLAAIGVVVTGRARTGPAHTWGPLGLAAFSLGAVAVAYQNAPAWDGMAAGFAVASVLGGAAIAWWLAARLRGPARTRVSVAVLIGVGYAAFVGIVVAPMLAFVLPVLAAAFIVWASRNPPLHATPPERSTQPPARDAVPSAS